MPKKYPYAQGYFGKSSESTGNSNRSIISINNIEEAYDFYDKLTFGGIEREIIGNIKTTYMRDGTVITIRKSTTSDKMPVADISITYTLSPRSIKMQKIRFIQKDFHEKDRL